MQSELLKGTLQTIVLKLLSENGKMYGYEITKKVKELTKGQFELTEGALYPTLHKLEAQGNLSAETVQIGKRLRKYYRLTESGEKETAAKISELEAFILGLQQIIQAKIA